MMGSTRVAQRVSRRCGRPDPRRSGRLLGHVPDVLLDPCGQRLHAERLGVERRRRLELLDLLRRQLPLFLPTAGEGNPVPVTGNGSARPLNGYETVHITDTVMLTAGEISGTIAEMRRQGTKATGFYRSAWIGEELGTTAGALTRSGWGGDVTARSSGSLIR
jgi:hypothetical protein